MDPFAIAQWYLSIEIHTAPMAEEIGLMHHMDEHVLAVQPVAEDVERVLKDLTCLGSVLWCTLCCRGIHMTLDILGILFREFESYKSAIDLK